MRTGKTCLNTLSGGHPLRTPVTLDGRVGLSGSQYPLRRAPSSDPGTYEVDGVITESQYPLRRAPSSDPTPPFRLTPPPSRLNTLSGGHPLRTGTVQARRLRQLWSQYPLRRAPSSDRHYGRHLQGHLCLNTLSGGHPLRTGITAIGPHRLVMSQYPLRRAPSSDQLSYPSDADDSVPNTLSGGPPLRTSL